MEKKNFLLYKFSKFLPDRLNFYLTQSSVQTYLETTVLVIVVWQNLHVFDCPGSNFKSQKRILGFVDRTVRPLSPLLGTKDVSPAERINVPFLAKVIINIASNFFGSQNFHCKSDRKWNLR